MDELGAVVLDVDGTVLRGERALAGAVETVEHAREAGLEVLFVTNNPTRRPTAYARRLRSAGVPASAPEVVTAGSVTADYLVDEHPGETAYVVGEAGLLDQLDERSVPTTTDPEAADVVVGSIDRAFDYDRLAAAARALDGGTPLVGTDPDPTIPSAEGVVPGSGAVIAALASVADGETVTLGKPSERAARAVLDCLGVAPGECLVVGDRPDTDVALGRRVGARTALVETGVDGPADPVPDHRVADVGEVRELF
jgi:4-nitrophenyl phosphatase